MKKIHWYVSRLRSMSVKELFYRVEQVLKSLLDRYKKNHFTHNYLFYWNILDKSSVVDHFDFSCVKNELEVFKSFNYFNFFTFRMDLNMPIDWHLDISSQKKFPLTYSKSINIRSDEFGSAKVVWEINRMQFLLPLLFKYKATGNKVVLEQFQYFVKDWIDNNPYLKGVNWYSNIEVNIRLIVWYYCWGILFSDAELVRDKEFRRFAAEIWLPSIYEHCVYSYSNPSKYSSSNNHLIAEYSGLFVASSLWKFDEAQLWNNYAKNGLEEEIQRQHSESGINREQAAEYIQFITDFFVIPFAISLRDTSLAFSKDYSDKLFKIFKYISVLLDIKKGYRKYGDEDDGRVLMVSSENHFDNFSSLLTTGSIIFEDGELKTLGNHFDLKNYLLFGEEGKAKYDNIALLKKDRDSSFFKEEGHFVFRKEAGDKEIYLHFDAAPLGYLSIAAHGHADALSIVLHINGNPILVDVGTYTYHTEREWRNYFVSTLAHNTVCIDNIDQADLTGPTMWHRHYKCEVLNVVKTNSIELVEAEHNGYSHFNCNHSRRVNFYRHENRFVIEDSISIDRKEREIKLPWHFHPDTDVEIAENNQVTIWRDQKKVCTFVMDDDLDLSLHKGENTPILGWYSPSFMVKMPSPTIIGKYKGVAKKNIKILTEIIILN